VYRCFRDGYDLIRAIRSVAVSSLVPDQSGKWQVGYAMGAAKICRAIAYLLARAGIRPEWQCGRTVVGVIRCCKTIAS